MSGRYLLDTNIVIALFANEAVVQQKLSAATEVFIPSIVLGELYYGAYKSARAASNITRVNEFAASNPVLVCDTETAQHYGQIKEKLRAKGHPIPENDIWIAAVAVQQQLTLISRDGHFDSVDGLLREIW